MPKPTKAQAKVRDSLEAFHLHAAAAKLLKIKQEAPMRLLLHVPGAHLVHTRLPFGAVWCLCYSTPRISSTNSQKLCRPHLSEQLKSPHIPAAATCTTFCILHLFALIPLLPVPHIFIMHWFPGNYLVTGFLSLQLDCQRDNFSLFNKQRNNTMQHMITVCSPQQ